MQSIPQKTVDMWIAQEKRLDPARLIPALVQYDNIKDRSQVGGKLCCTLQKCSKEGILIALAVLNHLLELLTFVIGKKKLALLKLMFVMC